MYYTVRPGDNLWSIAQRFNVTLQALMNANNIADPSQIFIGQRLLIPTAGVPGFPPPGQNPPPQQPGGGWQQRLTRVEREVDRLQRENNRLQRQLERLQAEVNRLERRVARLEGPRE